MIDTDKYEGHMNGYYFEGSNFDLSHLTMYDSNDNILAVLKSNDKSLMGGSTFVSPTIELMVAAPLLLAEYKKLREQQQKILRIAETNMALEWGDTNHSFEWGYIIDMIKGWTE